MAFSISGLSSGLDWDSIITQLVALERRPITLLENKQTVLSQRKSAWSEVNTMLASLKTDVGSLSSLDDFDLFTPRASISGTTRDVEDFIRFAVGSNATEGSYSITVNNLAESQKLSSKSFGSTSGALGISGDVIINSRVLSISATDSLGNIQTKINALNFGENPAGVTASILSLSDGEYRMSITSKATGSEGISIANASGSDILTELGLADGTLTLRNAVTGGAQSEAFSSSTDIVGDALGLTSAASGTVTIAGAGVNIDLSADSLEDIAGTINGNGVLQAAGVSASIFSSTDDNGTAVYTLQIDGTQSFVDSNNILQTLGVLKQGYSDVSGVTGNAQNTTNGTAISESTLLTDIDGYNTWTSGDTITIEGLDHDGVGVGPTDFTITSTSTMGDLLDAIETAFGSEVNAYVDGSGALVVEDNQSGVSNLSLALSSSIAAMNSSLDFGTFDLSTIRKREVVAGQDSEITIDGVTFSRSTNQISDVIGGVTLDLVGADQDATITLNVNRDYDGVKEKIQDIVDGYNKLMSYIDKQNTASADGKTTGTLFADSSLRSVKTTLRGIVLSEVSGLDSTLTRLSLIGISIDKTGQLSIDDDELVGYLQTNFQEVVNLFAAQGSSTSNDLTYIHSTANTNIEGDYDVEITQVATRASVLGSGFSGTLSSDATLTLTSSGGTQQTISLSAGWNITSIVNAINSGNTLGITAENDGGQLSISNSLYGSSGDFTVSGISVELGIADGDYAGDDAAGRIRVQGASEWMTMTGKGQTLTGDDGQDVHGLVIKYTGTTTDTLDFTFTKGVADKLDQALYTMTDSVDGYVATKQNSLQSQIEKIDGKIDNMEVRLTKYQETLMAKYSAMESMLSTLQAQQSWLESQISSLTSSWGKS